MDEQFYMAFHKKFPADKAIELFQKKHSAKPERIFIDRNLLKLGPEPERKQDVVRKMSE